MMDTKTEVLPAAGCPGQTRLPTPAEKQCLDAMRAIKNRVREIKKHMGGRGTMDTTRGADGFSDWEEELAELKRSWDDWERRWREAVRERMVALGHEDP